MNGSSHPKHENRKCERDRHLMAPSGHGGTVRRFQICFRSLIHNKSAPSRVVVSFARKCKEISTPIHIAKKNRFYWES